MNRTVNWRPLLGLLAMPNLATAIPLKDFMDTGFSPDSLYGEFMLKTPKIGFWLDNSNQTPEESATCILERFAQP